MAKQNKEKKGSTKKKDKKRKKAGGGGRGMLGSGLAAVTGLVSSSGESIRSAGSAVGSAAVDATTWSAELTGRLTRMFAEGARGIAGGTESAAGDVAKFIEDRMTALVTEFKREYQTGEPGRGESSGSGAVALAGGTGLGHAGESGRAKPAARKAPAKRAASKSGAARAGGAKAGAEAGGAKTRAAKPRAAKAGAAKRASAKSAAPKAGSRKAPAGAAKRRAPKAGAAPAASDSES